MTNVTSQGLMQLTLVITGLVLHVMLPRWLPVDEYGAYQTVLGMSALAAVFSGLRVNLLATQRVAKAPQAGGRVVGTALALVAALALPTATLLLGYAALADGRTQVLHIAVAASFVITLHAAFGVLQGAAQGMRKMRFQLPAVLLWRVSEVVLVGLGLLLGIGAEGVHWIRALALLAGLWLLWRTIGQLMRVDPPWSIPWGEVLQLGRESIPFGIDGLFATAYLAADILVLAYFHGDVAVAVYGVATVPVSNLVFIGFVVNRVLHPMMAARNGDAEGVGQLLGLGIRIHLAVALPVAVGGMLVAEPLLVFVFGEPFAASAVPFVWMLPLLPFRYINHCMGLTLTALDRQPVRARAMGVVAVSNVIANLLVVPTWGVVGAAATTLGSELLLVLVYSGALYGRVRGVHFLGAGLRGLLALAPLVVAVVALAGEHVLVRVLVGAVVYLFAAWLVGAVRRGDVRALRRA